MARASLWHMPNVARREKTPGAGSSGGLPWEGSDLLGLLHLELGERLQVGLARPAVLAEVAQSVLELRRIFDRLVQLGLRRQALADAPLHETDPDLLGVRKRLVEVDRERPGADLPLGDEKCAEHLRGTQALAPVVGVRRILIPLGAVSVLDLAVQDVLQVLALAPALGVGQLDGIGERVAAHVVLLLIPLGYCVISRAPSPYTARYPAYSASVIRPIS